MGSAQNSGRERKENCLVPLLTNCRARKKDSNEEGECDSHDPE
jgi:hypothetical protein